MIMSIQVFFLALSGLKPHYRTIPGFKSTIGTKKVSDDIVGKGENSGD